MKRYVVELEQTYAELLSDAAYAYPALSAEFERDLARLTRLSSSRGLPFFMVDLPKLGKHLDRCLSEGQYKQSGLPTAKRAPGCVGIPILFRGLYLLVFDKQGRLKENVDEQAILFLRTLLSCAKKAAVACSDEARDREVEAFVAVDAEVRTPPETWQDPSQTGIALTSAGFAADAFYLERCSERFGSKRALTLLRRLDRISGIVSTTLGPYRLEDWSFGHGPGSVSNCPQWANRYRFDNWCERLETSFPFADAAFSNYANWADTIRLEPLRAFFRAGVVGSREPASRLLAVNKTLTKPRLIASEPSEMMWCQQNLRHYMYDRCEASWINLFVDFRSQERNQRLALSGSIDGSLATIDLSAASDRVSCQVVGNLFRANQPLLRALAATRTQFCELPNGRVVRLNKFSTMGNATTFPVQTLVFLSIALACVVEEEAVTPTVLERYSGQVSIFGDDIIVPTEKSQDVMALLEALGFKVNADKSFWTGHFRESCGVDAFRGVDVTPAYWHGVHEQTPESTASCIAVANNFFAKYMVRTSAGIERRMRGIKFPTVVVGSGVLGLHTFCIPPVAYPTRWNQGLQRVEHLIPVMSTRGERARIGDDTALLQYFTEAPQPWDPWKSGWKLRPLLKIKKRWVPTTQFLRTEV